ncbi:hypothetical protein GC177_08470 [bacterium]|nr:hypothetical protein [bacterium]
MNIYRDAIQPLRDQIDAIDRELVQLLKKRSQVVQQVGHVKQSFHPTACYIRPAREANMTEAAMGWDAAPFPKAYMALIWRNIINGSLNIEQPINASAPVRNGARDYVWLAREYFGAVTQVQERGESGDVLADIAAGRAMVGALPMPGEGPANADDWWVQLTRHPKLRVFATAPLFESPGLPRALLVADVEPEASGRDASLVVSQSAGPVILEGAEKLASIQKDGRWYGLWRMEHFLTPEAFDALKTKQAQTGMDIWFIGSYALPQTIAK